MKVEQLVLSQGITDKELKKLSDIEPQLVLVFADRDYIQRYINTGQLQSFFKDATIAGCSTAGEISTNGVSDDSAVITAIHFDKSQVAMVSVKHENMQSSYETGKKLAQALPQDNLKAVLLYSVGLNINGSALLEGLHTDMKENVVVAGGLAADKAKFEKTLVIANDEVLEDGVIAIGLYGNINVTAGSSHGWEIFGPMRKVTKCHDNVLYELDDTPALDVYKKYLGEYAKDLPSSALLFPLMMSDEKHFDDNEVIRTILGINEEEGSLTLAGTVHEGAFAQMMHSNTEQLIDGAEDAAKKVEVPQTPHDSLAILVSCVGRYLVMADEADDEITAVSDYVGSDCPICGFYSYGEISTNEEHPFGQLHNQTMTVALLRET